MLSLSVSFILFPLRNPQKDQALVLSMILFLRSRKMTELCATRMELNYAFVELPQLFARASTGFENDKEAAN